MFAIWILSTALCSYLWNFYILYLLQSLVNNIDKDALKAEFAALVKPFKTSRAYARSIAPCDMPVDRIVQIIRQMKDTAKVADMPKFIDDAEAASLLVCDPFGSFVEERHAVYHTFIN